MSTCHKRKRLLEEVSRQVDPLNPSDLSQKRLLELLDINPEASLNLLERAEGNIFNLSGTDLKTLTDIDGVGRAVAARLIVLFALISQYESWQSAQAKRHHKQSAKLKE